METHLSHIKPILRIHHNKALSPFTIKLLMFMNGEK